MKRARALGLLMLGAGLVVAFQNCSQPAEPPEVSKVSAEALKAEFAYDGAIDQIAYMSCNQLSLASNGGFDRSTYFTVRAGAYGGMGGLKIKDNFMNKYLIEKQKTPERLAQLIVESPANRSTIPQLALRMAGNYQTLLTTSGTPRDGDDYSNMLEELGTKAMSDLLIQNSPSRVRYVRNGITTGARFEGNLYFTSSLDLAQSVRSSLTNNFILGMTYTYRGAAANSQTDARSPYFLTDDPAEKAKWNPNTNVFGRGYKLTFRQPDLTATFDKKNPGSIATNIQQAVLNSVTEVSMGVENPNDPKSMNYLDSRPWTCPAAMRFRVVLPEDAKTIGCQIQPDPASPSVNLQLVRNSLRTEDWYVDMNNRCIVPKKPGLGQTCYGNMRYVEYDLTMGANNVNEQCNPSPTTNSAVVKVCGSFASICYRQ